MLRDNPNPADEDEEWQDVEVSEEWGNFLKLLFLSSLFGKISGNFFRKIPEFFIKTPYLS